MFLEDFLILNAEKIDESSLYSNLISQKPLIFTEVT